MTNQQTARGNPGGRHLYFLYTLYFLSGITGLIFQVVWLYRLGLVFGNAAYATAATLAAFFLGIALGGWFIGNATGRIKRPLALYGLIEVAIALTAWLWLPGIGFYQAHYASLVDLFNANHALLTLMKFVFSTSLLLLPTMLMGGTFPVLAQYVGKDSGKLASRGTILYAFNTLGASLGAFVAGFFLMKTYGVAFTYNLAMVLAAGIGITALILDRLRVKEPANRGDKMQAKSKTAVSLLPELTGLQFMLVAFASGLLALAAETIWTRMFAQVLQNSVYSFSAILVVFLIALGFGGVLSHFLVRYSKSSIKVLVVLFTVSMVLIGFSPVVFNYLTDGLNYLAAGATWPAYLVAVFKLSMLVVFPPTVVLGAAFPFLLKAAPEKNMVAGKFVGKLVLLNSLGGTVGPVLAGFVLLDLLGLWNSIKLVAIVYGALALWLLSQQAMARKLWYLPLAGMISIILIVNPPLVKLDARQQLMAMWQSSDGVLTVVESAGNLQMRLNNFYVLGDSRSALVEQMQGHIPLLIHPAPEKTLFLGMGTGITAGAALQHPVEKVVVVELVGNVIPAARKFFTSWTNGLFTDKRVEIVSDDARNYLLGSREKFDVIVGDLFTPWHAGTGSLYTIEHFQEAKNKLAVDGIFAQWLPLYQLTPESLAVIIKTFTTVFPQVTLWRADFSATGASIVLVGQPAGAKLNHRVLQQNIGSVVGGKKPGSNHMAGLFYLGNARALQDRLSGVTINSDDKRVIEFKAPVLTQQVAAGKNTFVVGEELESLLTTLAANLPPDEDPYLSALPSGEITYVKVGLLYFQYLRLSNSGNQSEAAKIKADIQLLAPGFLAEP